MIFPTTYAFLEMNALNVILTRYLNINRIINSYIFVIRYFVLFFFLIWHRRVVRLAFEGIRYQNKTTGMHCRFDRSAVEKIIYEGNTPSMNYGSDSSDSKSFGGLMKFYTNVGSVTEEWRDGKR
jgi:hypothetical protein